MNRNAIGAGIGFTALTVGMSILFVTNDSMIKIAGGGMAFIGIALCLISYKLAIDDDRKEVTKMAYEMDGIRTIISEIKNMNSNISELANEIRQERNERNNKPKQ